MRIRIRSLAALIAAANMLFVAPEAAAFSSGGSFASRTLETVSAGAAVRRGRAASSADNSMSSIDVKSVATGAIYVDNSDWSWLTTPGAVVPGGKITTGSVACTIGWVVRYGGTDHLLTAGHCADNGTTFNLRNADGTLNPVGAVTGRRLDRDVAIDWELVSIDSSVPVQQRLPLSNSVGEVYTPEQAAKADAICVLGQVSGLSCGAYQYTSPAGRFVFEAEATNGDSGSPIFALKNNVAHPVGILEGGYDGTNNISVVTLDRIIADLGIEEVRV